MNKKSNLAEAKSVNNDNPTKDEPTEATDIVQFDKFIEIPVRILRTIGITILPVKVRLFSFVCAFCNISCTLALVIYFVAAFVNGTAVFITTVFSVMAMNYNSLAMAKMVGFIQHSSLFDLFISDLRKHFPKTVAEQDDYEVKRHYAETTRLLIFNFVCMFTMISTYIGISMYVRGPVYKNGQYFPFDLVFPMYYPFDEHRHGIFEVVLTIHWITNYSETACIYSIDSMVLSILQQICMHFQQLSKTLLEVKAIKAGTMTEKEMIRESVIRHMIVIQ